MFILALGASTKFIYTNQISMVMYSKYFLLPILSCIPPSGGFKPITIKLAGKQACCQFATKSPLEMGLFYDYNHSVDSAS